MGFRTPIVLARVRFYGVFLFFLLFFSPIFSSCYSVSEPFSRRAIIFDRLFGGETTLYLRLERPYYAPDYVTAFLH